jgi:hypothetical protein
VLTWESFFIRGSDLHLSCELTGVDVGFIFHLWMTRRYPKFQILMFLVQSTYLNFRQARSFGPAEQYPLLMSHTVTLGVVHLTHQPCSSFNALIRHGLVIEFTSTLLKLTDDPKAIQNPTGADVGAIFQDVAVGGFGRVSQV